MISEIGRLTRIGFITEDDPTTVVGALVSLKEEISGGVTYYIAAVLGDKYFGKTPVSIEVAESIMREFSQGSLQRYDNGTFRIVKVERHETLSVGEYDLYLSDGVVSYPRGSEIYKILNSVLRDSDDSNPNALTRDYPQVARFISKFAGNLEHERTAFILTFSVKPSGKQYLRFRGNLTPEQIEALKKAAKVPDGLQSTQNGEWTEFRGENTESLMLVDVQSQNNWGMSWYVHEFRQPDGRGELHINGRHVSGRDAKMKAGDLIVWVVPEDEDISFDNMPIVQVLNPEVSEEHGPFIHPEFVGRTLNNLPGNRRLRSLLGIKDASGVVVSSPEYHPDEEDRDDELDEDDEIYWHRILSPEEELYAFQAPGLAGEDGTARLKPWAPAVIGRLTDGWPREIGKLTINGVDKTAATCGVTVRPKSVLKVYLKREN